MSWQCDGRWQCSLGNVPCNAQDREDDVRAVSAEALLPIVSLISQQETEAALDTENALWDLLLDVDDLSVSTGEHAPAAGSTEIPAKHFRKLLH